MDLVLEDLVAKVGGELICSLWDGCEHHLIHVVEGDLALCPCKEVEVRAPPVLVFICCQKSTTENGSLISFMSSCTRFTKNMPHSTGECWGAFPFRNANSVGSVSLALMVMKRSGFPNLSIMVHSSRSFWEK